MNENEILVKLDILIEKEFINLQYVQDRVEAICKHQDIDIKQISDLERYFRMQKDIINTIETLKKMSGV